MNVPLFGCAGMITFLSCVQRIQDKPTFYKFPSGEEWENVEFECNQKNPRKFLKRLIKEACSSRAVSEDAAIRACELSPGLAIFMEVQSTGEYLDRCSVQAVIAPPETTITDLFLGDAGKATYCRLDYSIEERGNLFDHPFPHVHIEPEGPPRFPFSINQKVFPALSFLEFLLANYSHDKWTEWLFQELGKRYPSVTPEEELTADELLDRYKSKTTWNAVDESIRRSFLTKLKNASKHTMEKISKNHPKMREDDLKLNYWNAAPEVAVTKE